jgi:hypothetical protein
MGFSPLFIAGLETIEVALAQEIEAYVDWLESGIQFARGDPLPPFPLEIEPLSIADVPEFFSWNLVRPTMDMKSSPLFFFSHQVWSLGIAMPFVDDTHVWAPVVRGDATAIESLASEIRVEQGRCNQSLPRRMLPSSTSPSATAPAIPASSTAPSTFAASAAPSTASTTSRVFRRSLEPIRMLARALNVAQATGDVFATVKCVHTAALILIYWYENAPLGATILQILAGHLSALMKCPAFLECSEFSFQRRYTHSCCISVFFENSKNQGNQLFVSQR